MLGKATFLRYAATVVALLLATSSRAAELCVQCTGPDARYACVLNQLDTANVDTVIKLYCITALAKAGSHASCTIDRTSSAPCQGVRKELPLPSALDATNDDAPSSPETTKPNASTNVTAPPSPAAPVEAPKEPADNAPPKTVQEMIEKSTKSAGDGIGQTQKSAGDAAKSAETALQKAGTAVTDAAKNSWKCLSSFFSKC